MSIHSYLQSRPRELAFLARPGERAVDWLLTGPLAGLLRRRFARRVARLAQEFDAAFYLRQIADPRLRRGAAGAPVLHYLLLGRFFDLSPAPHFDARYYRTHNPEIAPGCSPFEHYVQVGRRRGRAPHPEARQPGIDGARPAALLFDHGRGGGSTRYLDFYERHLQERGYATLRATRLGGSGAAFVVDRANPAGPAGCFEPFSDAGPLAAFVRERCVRRIVANHMIDLPDSAYDWLPGLAAQSGADYEVLLHDYYYACPRVNLVDSGGRYCGLRDAAGCRRCLARSPLALRYIDPAQWRARSNRLLAGAARLVAPSEDLARRLAPQFAGLRIDVLEPEDDRAWPAERQPWLGAAEPLHLALIGALNQAKGYGAVARLAHVSRLAGAPLRLTLLGASDGDRRLRRLGVAVHGRYREAELDALLAGCAAHAVLLPAIWPETWSFVLSAALRRGLPVIAFDHGAIASRLRRLRRGTLLPPQLADDPAAVLAELMRWRDGRIAQARAA